MIRFAPVLALVLTAAACGGGPRRPSAQANQVYFWRIVSSEISFGTCSDDPQFRKDNVPLPFEESSFLIYKVAADARTAVSQKCARVEPSACSPSPSMEVFTIAGPELIFTSEGKSDFGPPNTCHLLDTTTWLLTDLGETGTLELSHVLSLVDDPMACMTSEAQFKKQSPNGLGLEGCVVTFKLGLKINQN